MNIDTTKIWPDRAVAESQGHGRFAHVYKAAYAETDRVAAVNDRCSVSIHICLHRCADIFNRNKDPVPIPAYFSISISYAFPFSRIGITPEIPYTVPGSCLYSP